MTRAILRFLATTLIAWGLAAGCSSNGKAIAQHSPDAQAPGLDALAGGGGAAGSGSDAAAAGSGGSGGVTESGGVTATTASTQTGGATGSGGTTPIGGATGTGGVVSSGGDTSSGGSSAPGGSGGKGGAGSGGTSSTGGPDGSVDKPPATWGTPCSVQDDCGPYGGYLMCRAPGESFGCGMCWRASGDCTSDADCVGDGGSTTSTMICELAPSSACYCSVVKVCVVGCRKNADCGPGQGCNPSHVCQNTCVAGDGTCPVNYSCGASGFCQQDSCTSDSECSGFCVKGSCYQTRGACQPIPA